MMGFSFFHQIQHDGVLEHRHFRNDFWAESTDGQYKFRIFLRQSAEFDEDFSIGLHYYPKDVEKYFPGIFQNLLFPESIEIDASDRDPEKPIS